MDSGRQEPKNPNDILVPAQHEKIPNEKVNEYLAKGYKITKQYEHDAIVFKDAITVGMPEASTDGERESQADRMYKLFCLNTNVNLFFDQNKTEYARIPVEVIKEPKTLDAIDAICGIRGTIIASNNHEFSPPQQTPPVLDCKSSVNSVNSVNEREQLIEELKNADSQDETDIVLSKIKEEIKKRTVVSNEIVRLKEEKFKTYLAHLLFEAEQKVANSEAITQVIRLLKYDASHGKCFHLHNRVAVDPKGDGSLWLDMADAQNRAYHITKDGWTIESNVPILFRHYEHQLPLVEAVHDGDTKKLLPFVNIGASKDSKATKHRQLLLLVQTASYLVPDIPHPINAMFGCPGSHKTYAQKCIRSIFDPSSAPTLRMPRDENAALQILDHHYIPIFDNLFYMPQWFSDMLCSSVTGAGMESRALYTDDDSFIRSFKRCIMLNGVNLPATKGDLLSRIVLHPTEPNAERRTEKELDAEYNKVLPSILGGFLDIMVKALKLKDTEEAKPIKKFRLADFTEWGCAIAVAMGETVIEFTKAMEENLESQNASDIENNTVAEAFIAYCTSDMVIQMATDDNPFQSTPTDIFKAVEMKAQTLGTNTKNTKKWPSITSAFTRKLNDSKNAIISCGWNYDIVPDGNKRTMTIWHIGKPLVDDKKPKFIYETVPPAEPCDCGKFAVTKLTTSPDKSKLRQCEECFKRLQDNFKHGANFIQKEAIETSKGL